MPMTWFLAFTGTIFILLTMLIITFWATPATAWLKARMKSSHLILLAKRTGELQPVPGKYRTGTGMIETKNHGMYLMLPSAKYIFSGVTCGLAYEDSGVTLPENYVKGANILRSEGVLPQAVVEELEKGKSPRNLADKIVDAQEVMQDGGNQ